MRLAAIDIGTNSTRLLISDILKPGYKKTEVSLPGKNLSHTVRKVTCKPIARDMHITRLGRNLGKSGQISKKNAAETLNVLKKYLETMYFYKVEKYRAVGTKALRQAKNSSWFKNQMISQLGMHIDIVSPKKEAELSFNGALGFFKRGKDRVKCISRLNDENYSEEIYSGNILVIDIGGGSTEFISGNINNGISYIGSIDIGSVNISERFRASDVCKPSDILKMQEFIKINISDTINKIMQNPPHMVLGLAGTVSALASVDMGLEKYNMNTLNGYVLKLKNIIDIHDRFCSLDLGRRKMVKGLEPERADIIIGGTEILIAVLKGLEKDRLIVSENDILDGIIYSIF